jgi:hypothetical protein
MHGDQWKKDELHQADDRAGEVVPRQVHRRVRRDNGRQLGRQRAGELV